MAASVDHLDALSALEQGGFTADQLGLLQSEIGIATWVWDVTEPTAIWYGDPSGLLGFAPGTFGGTLQQCLERVHPEDRLRARNTLVDCLKGVQPVYRTEGRVIWPDGSLHRLACYGRGFYGADGRAVRLAGVVREVSESELAPKSWRKFETLFETSPEGIVVARPRDRAIVEINDAALRLIGISRAEAMGPRSRDIVSWVGDAGGSEFRDRLFHGERVVGEVQAFKRPDGKVVEAICSASRVEVDGDTYFVISMRDMTDVRRIERAGAESERRFRTLFVEAPDGIIVISPEGTILSANPAACRVTGYSVEEILGEPTGRLFGAPTRDRAPAGVSEVLSGALKRADLEIQAKNGSRLPVEVLAERLPNGNLLVFVRDISERKRHEQMLMSLARGVSVEAGDTFFQSLVSHVGRALVADYVMIGEIIPTNRERVRSLAFWNQGAPGPNFEYGLLGTPCAEALKRPSTLMFPNRVGAIFPDDKEIRDLQVEGYVGTSLFDTRGSVIGIFVAMSRKPIAEPSLWASVLEIFAARAAAEIERSRAEEQVRDLNVSLELRVAERTRELEAANRELDAFSYSVSHDLRAPLHAIAGFAEIVRVAHGAAMPSKALHYFERIEHNARQMDVLIGELLEFSRAWRVPLNTSDVDMRRLVKEVLAEMQPEAVARAEIEVSELPPARGDRVLLRQVWSNLIGNALKFSRGASPPRIRITGERKERGVEYSVSDNGAGFDQRYADKLFGVFQRLHSSGEFEGSGVGLALVQRIVTRHGGKVAAEGAEGKGATFRFFLPQSG